MLVRVQLGLHPIQSLPVRLQRHPSRQAHPPPPDRPPEQGEPQLLPEHAQRTHPQSPLLRHVRNRRLTALHSQHFPSQLVRPRRHALGLLLQPALVHRLSPAPLHPLPQHPELLQV